MTVIPSQFAPHISPDDEFIGPPTGPADDRIEVGVAIVGGGPAGLACAIRLMQRLEQEPKLAESLGEVPVAVLEKGQTPGAHELSGAIMRPSAMRELFPDLDEEQWPTYGKVPGEAVYVIPNNKRAIRIPTPPPFKNHGNHLVSISQLSRFLARQAEEKGVYILSETSAVKLLVENDTVRGVRSGDRGRGRDGEPLSNFEPGSDVVAKATVLAEGTAGHLTGTAIRHFQLATEDSQVWALGVKEVWEVPKPLQRVIHTLGWPLRTAAKYKEFGGSWIYPMGENMVSIGFVVGLNYTDATLSVHDLLQQFKLHPLVKGILGGGKRIAWGAKTIPEGGYWAMPKLTVPGAILCGDSAGMVNVPELKGIHYAMYSGIYAADAIITGLKRHSNDFSAYEQAVENSIIGEDLFRTRNMKQPFEKGFFVGGAITNLMVASKGRLPGGHWDTEPDADQSVSDKGRKNSYPKPDGKYTFDKLSSVYLSGNQTRDDAPNHIRIRQNVPRELAELWKWMCPAQVYEIPEDAPKEGMVDLQVTPSNCIQCGAITAKGGRLTPAEGGDGPRYQVT